MSKFELNKGDQFLFGLDVSASMGTTDCPGNQSRLNYAKEQMKVFATEAGKYDPDGADYFTFGEKVTPYLNQSPEDAVALIDRLQANEGMTDTAGLINAAWSRAKQLRAEGVTDNIVLMIITDGAPADKDAVRGEIRGIAEELENGEEFGIIFLKVGSDAAVDAFLTELDDTLNAKHDIVDVKNLTEVNFVQAFNGAVND